MVFSGESGSADKPSLLVTGATGYSGGLRRRPQFRRSNAAAGGGGSSTLAAWRRATSRSASISAARPIVRVDPRARRAVAGHDLPALGLDIAAALLTRRLSSLSLGFVRPVYARVGRELIEGLKNRSVVTDPIALVAFPIRPVGLREAIRRVIRYEDRAFASTRWSHARSSGGAIRPPEDARFGGKRVEAQAPRGSRRGPRICAPSREWGASAVDALIFAGLLRAIGRRAGEGDADRHRPGGGAP